MNKEVINAVKGQVQMKVRNKDTGEYMDLREYEKLAGVRLSDLGFNSEGIKDNMVVNNFHYVMSYLFVNSSLSNNPIYLAVGSGNTAAQRSDTRLVTEVQRVTTRRAYDLTYSLAVVDPNRPDRSNCVRLSGLIKDGDFDINELGLFWGDSVAAVANTGSLMSRVVTSRPIPKLPNTELEFIWIYIFRFTN